MTTDSDETPGRECPPDGDELPCVEDGCEALVPLAMPYCAEHGYRPWSKWKRRRVHLRWAIADVFHGLGYRIQGDA